MAVPGSDRRRVRQMPSLMPGQVLLPSAAIFMAELADANLMIQRSEWVLLRIPVY